MRIATLLLFLLFVCSCGMSEKQKQELNALQVENENLQSKINKLQAENEEFKTELRKFHKVSDNPEGMRDAVRELSTSYVIFKIKYKRLYPDNSTESNFRIIHSPINEVLNWNEDLKYRLLDREQSIIESNVGGRIKTYSREAIVFKTYAEASRFLEDLDK